MLSLDAALVPSALAMQVYSAPLASFEIKQLPAKVYDGQWDADGCCVRVMSLPALRADLRVGVRGVRGVPGRVIGRSAWV